jgi:hypothetical protein
MVRTSQCFRTEYSQVDGPRTLAGAEAIPCALALPASLIKPDYGILRSRFVWSATITFSCVESSLGVHEGVPIHLPPAAVSPSTAIHDPFEIVARKAAVRGNP